MTTPHSQIVRDSTQRRLLRAALAATSELVKHTSGPLRGRWMKHERELAEALAKLDAKLEF